MVELGFNMRQYDFTCDEIMVMEDILDTWFTGESQRACRSVLLFPGESTMKRLILVCAVALLTFSTVTSPILAADDHTVRPVDPTQTRIYDPSRVPVTCLVGTLEPIAYAVSGWLAPPDKYARHTASGPWFCSRPCARHVTRLRRWAPVPRDSVND